MVDEGGRDSSGDVVGDHDNDIVCLFDGLDGISRWR